MKHVKLTETQVQERVRKASEFLRRVNPTLPVKENSIILAAEKFGLPLSVDLNGCPVVRTMFIGAYSPEAREQYRLGCSAVLRRYEQLASLEKSNQH